MTGLKHTGIARDNNGGLAAGGSVNETIVKKFGPSILRSPTNP
jgi:hypothetical protein